MGANGQRDHRPRRSRKPQLFQQDGRGSHVASRVAAAERVRRAIGEIGVGQQRRPGLDDDVAPALLEHGGSGEQHREHGRGMGALGAKAIAVLDAPPQIDAEERRPVQRAQPRAAIQHRHARFNRLDKRLHGRFYARTFPEAHRMARRLSMTAWH